MKKIHYCMLDRAGIECAARILFHDNIDIMPDPAEIADCLLDFLDSKFSGNICFIMGNHDNIDFLSFDFDAVTSAFQNYFSYIAKFNGLPDVPGIFNAYLFHCYIPE